MWLLKIVPKGGGKVNGNQEGKIVKFVSIVEPGHWGEAKSNVSAKHCGVYFAWVRLWRKVLSVYITRISLPHVLFECIVVPGCWMVMKIGSTLLIGSWFYR